MTDVLATFLHVALYLAGYCLVVATLVYGAFRWWAHRHPSRDPRPGFIDDSVLQSFVESWSETYYRTHRRP